MNRRGLMSAFTGLAAGMALDPERLLWVPGAKVISVPSPSPWPSNEKTIRAQLEFYRKINSQVFFFGQGMGLDVGGANDALGEVANNTNADTNRRNVTPTWIKAVQALSGAAQAGATAYAGRKGKSG